MSLVKLALGWYNRPGFVRIIASTTRSNCYRGYSQEAEIKKNAIKQQPVTKFRRYLLSRYIKYVQRYEKILESKFPSAMHVYRVFVVGIRDLYRDLKHFVKIFRSIHTQGKSLNTLTRKEVELYFQMPKDMRKVAPVLLISALPFANYVVFPLAYMFPKQLLSSHFWSLQQRMEFAVQNQRKRLYNNRPVFRCLQARLDELEGDELCKKWSHCLSLLGSGVHPEVSDVISVIRLFSTNHPYHLSSLYSYHVNALLRMHGMHIGWRRRKRLKDRALIIQQMDFAMIREGIHTMGVEELRWACFLRGLNPTNMKTEDMAIWLTQWVSVSKEVNKDSVSLLLHCPILLAYNHPTNWVLIH